MYDWPDKTQKELGIARDFNTHYETIVGCAVAKTTPREKGKDPPDIDLSFENGELVGLEITELVDEQAILATEHTNTAHYPLWPDAELHASITKLVEKRTGRENGKAVLTPDTFC
jgi:hypothetical protein